MSLRAGAVEVADDRGHAGLVAHGSGQVDGLLGVVLREAVAAPAVSLQSRCISSDSTEEPRHWGFDLRLDLAPVAGSALARQVRQRAMARGLVLCDRSVSDCKNNFSVLQCRNAESLQSFVLLRSAVVLRIEAEATWERVWGLLTPVRHGC